MAKNTEHQGEPDYDFNRELREWLGDALRDKDKLEAPDFCCNGAWAHELELAMVKRGWRYNHLGGEETPDQQRHSTHWWKFRGVTVGRTDKSPLRARRDAAHAAMVAEREAQAKEKQEST